MTLFEQWHTYKDDQGSKIASNTAHFLFVYWTETLLRNKRKPHDC